MVIKKISLLLCIPGYLYAQDTTLITKAHNITHTIFGDTGLDSPLQDRINMQEFIYNCLIASPYQLNIAAQLTLEALEKQYNQLQIKIDTLQPGQPHSSQNMFYKRFLLQKQIEHLKDFLQQNPLNTTQYFYGIVHRIYEDIFKRTKEFFGYTLQPITAQMLSDQVLQYIEYTRENILYNYDKLHTFLLQSSQTTLPAIVDFWQSKKLQQQLAKRAQLVSDNVKVQLIETLLSFALQGLVMAGGQVSIQWIDDQDRKVYEAYQKKQQKISKDWETFRQNLQLSQKDILNRIVKTFSQAQEKLKKEYQTTNARLQEALVYLNQAINLDQPIKRFLSGPVTWDQYFAASTMYTPRDTQPWYNIFNFYTTGDWEFNAQTNSFWQNGMTQMPKELLWNIADNSTKNIFDNDPAIHSIFTEYIPQKTSYAIEIECTIANIQYPFFVGIMFNRGRWISGDPERIWWYRLVGLYGIQEKPNDITSQTINLSFAQQILGTSQGQKETITSPLEQIIKKKTDAINFALDKNDITTLQNNPLTFIFKITTQADTVIIELDNKQDDGTIKKLYSGSVHDLDPYIYLFHGIGFMAVGAQAQFKINKPIELIYEKQELKDFTKKMETVTNKG